MRKIILFLFLPIFWQCSTGPSRNELQQKSDSLLIESAQKEIQLNQMIETMSEIDENIRIIKEKEQIISVNAESGDMRGRTGQQINEDIQLIYELMVQNKNRIQDLEKQLKNSGVDGQRANRLITGLNEQLREKTEEIMRLHEQLQQRELQIDRLNVEIMGLSTEMDSIRKLNEATRMQLASTTDRYNTAWYAMGTRRELRDQKILTRDGFLFFGSNRVLKEEFDKTYFNEVDIRETKSIPLYSSRVNIQTTHPEESYKLVEDEGGNLILSIQNPDLFWSITRYLVIRVN